MDSAADARTPQRGCLILVCGLPGSGKTSMALTLATDRRGVRLSPDEWIAALGMNLWDETARERVEALQRGLAEEVLHAGAVVIVSGGRGREGSVASCGKWPGMRVRASNWSSLTFRWTSCGDGSKRVDSRIRPYRGPTLKCGRACWSHQMMWSVPCLMPRQPADRRRSTPEDASWASWEASGHGRERGA